ncbi:hypothetical protein [Serinibacter salmoneus]|uniref:Uncharacterized protein n=1 Tax=Serinibacter salmoneus TaxID=556530 RepID=A0A2A9CWC0_9MICO|nr:hypothetical protein [Serinibacter salmoneus]PFG18724.1 hypothetical protein ATL40_0267 [Serinibacter salmoneus]
MTDAMELLRDLDPAPEGESTARAIGADDAAFAALWSRIEHEQQSAGDRGTSGDLCRTRRRRWSLAGLGLAAAVTGAVVLWPSGPTAPVAHAGWVPDPAPVAASDLSAWAEYACAADRSQDGIDRGGATHPDPPRVDDLQPVAAEQRGEAVLVLSAGSEAWSTCLTAESGWGGMRATTRLTDLDTGETIGNWHLSQATHHAAAGQPGFAWDAVVFGAQVADDVERVVLTLGSGFEVDATVAEGFALAWWPQEGSGAESVDAVAITLIDESGAVVEEIKIPAVPSQ